MAELEEVVLYAFQQCVYYVSKVRPAAPQGSRPLSPLTVPASLPPPPPDAQGVCGPLQVVTAPFTGAGTEPPEAPAALVGAPGTPRTHTPPPQACAPGPANAAVSSPPSPCTSASRPCWSAPLSRRSPARAGARPPSCPRSCAASCPFTRPRWTSCGRPRCTPRLCPRCWPTSSSSPALCSSTSSWTRVSRAAALLRNARGVLTPGLRRRAGVLQGEAPEQGMPHSLSCGQALCQCLHGPRGLSWFPVSPAAPQPLGTRREQAERSEVILAPPPCPPKSSLQTSPEAQGRCGHGDTNRDTPQHWGSLSWASQAQRGRGRAWVGARGSLETWTTSLQ